MTIEEKLAFIKDAHKLTMKYRLWDAPQKAFAELKALDDEHWSIFSATLLPKMPKAFYRYRPFNKYSVDELRNEYAWFSPPAEFDDGTDSTLNLDIEEEVEELSAHPEAAIIPLSKAIISQQYKRITGLKPDDEMIEEAIRLWPEGKLDITAAKTALTKYCPGQSSDTLIKMIEHFNKTPLEDSISKPLKGLVEFYMSLNQRLRSGLFCLCLAESYSNDVMWAKYAGERTGFCIEYDIPATSLIGQKTLMATNPIYYGEKKPMHLLNILIDGLSADDEDKINGWTKKMYEDINVSSLTKSSDWSFQKEWRVSFAPEAGGNRQRFPFVKAIYIGDRMSPENRRTIFEIAKSHGWNIYERKMNKTSSKVVYQQVKRVING
ncbi:MAG: DUF2971 domain-containing protein [Bacilli bacterium]|nr:DUF2971 domain-containing protein [Bacilli bacterium]